jgi:hypothetical protein
MAILTVITSLTNELTNVSPIPFTITFSESVQGLDISDFDVSGGTVVRLTGSGAVYTAQVSPNQQGSTVSLFLPANVTNASAHPNDPNALSNTITREFLSTRPRSYIEHNISPNTNSKKLRIAVNFDRDVIGFTSNDFNLKNASVTSFSGSGANYNVTITPKKVGLVEFFVPGGAATDLYGNNSRRSNEITLQFDSATVDEKEAITNKQVPTRENLLKFDVNELHQVVAINKLADCAKNLPQRLMDLAVMKAVKLAQSNANVRKIASTVALAAASIETVKAISDDIKKRNVTPKTLLEEALDAKGLTGDALRAKIEALTAKYAAVNNVNEILDRALNSDLCKQTNFFADGTPAAKLSFIPTDVEPQRIPGVIAGVNDTTRDPLPKDNYDAFMFQLKEHIEIGSASEQDPDRAKMISVLTTITMGYHDQISRTLDSSEDLKFNELFLKNADNERNRNAVWPDAIKNSFDRRVSIIAALIQNNVEVIRNFYNRNTMASGKPISTGITTYSGPDKDFTTFLDIKPEERPPELTQYWTGRGYDIKKNEERLKARGIKTGTLKYEYTSKGAYGPLESDFTCASSRFPGGSVILLKNPDGTIYNPTGRNPSGKYRVTDTGNARLTYMKPDIFTNTPELYRNMATVQVFLISTGNQTGPQYRLAQQRYGSNNSA